jgi:catechol 1,2-dioxygenase
MRRARRLDDLALQADTVLHEDPADIAEHGFQQPYRSAEFDFILKTRTSPDTATPKDTAA